MLENLNTYHKVNRIIFEVSLRKDPLVSKVRFMFLNNSLYLANVDSFLYDSSSALFSLFFFTTIIPILLSCSNFDYHKILTSTRDYLFYLDCMSNIISISSLYFAINYHGDKSSHLTYS